MIDALILRTGPNGGDGPQRVPVSGVTVFVGPNNAGKSRLLKEIAQQCLQGSSTNANHVILESVEFERCERPEALRRVKALEVDDPQRDEGSDITDIGVYGTTRISRDALVRTITDPSLHGNVDFRNLYVGPGFMSLGGAERLGLVGKQPARDLKEHPGTAVERLFRDPDRRSLFRRILHDAFGEYVSIDPTELGYLTLRISAQAPAEGIERSLSDAAVAYFRNATPLEQKSDGVKAFAGITLQLIAGSPSILVIDEPEAFLHPALAQRLAQHIADVSSDKRVFVATHSPQFLMGCIQSRAAVTIVRLTFRSGVGTARTLAAGDLEVLMRNPMLRSTGAVAGVFYESVVVTEGDSDRAFYEEVNDRMRQANPPADITSCLFINAQNKQTIHALVTPLRRLGIPAAAVVDLDVLKEGGTNWINLLNSANVPEIERLGLSQTRAALLQRYENRGLDLNTGGVAILEGPDLEAAKNMLDRLREYGIFVVPVGELEGWLPVLGGGTTKHSWLSRVFERMGSNPAAAGYVRPETGDVWDFVRSIRNWTLNPARKGMPAS